VDQYEEDEKENDPVHGGDHEFDVSLEEA